MVDAQTVHLQWESVKVHFEYMPLLSNSWFYRLSLLMSLAAYFSSLSLFLQFQELPLTDIPLPLYIKSSSCLYMAYTWKLPTSVQCSICVPLGCCQYYSVEVSEQANNSWVISRRVGSGSGVIYLAGFLDNFMISHVRYLFISLISGVT